MEEPKNELPTWNNGWGVRHSQILLYFACITVVYLLRLNLTLAVVAMTTSTNNVETIYINMPSTGVYASSYSFLSILELFDNGINGHQKSGLSVIKTVLYNGNWFCKLDKNVPLGPGEKALVLSSLFWGYGILQTILGNLGRKTNSVRVLSYCVLTSAFLSLATPFAAIHYGAVGIIVVRVLIGLLHGGVYPNMNNLLSMWAVPQEKHILVPIVYNGLAFGTFLAMMSAGYLAARYGWPSIFYSSGGLGIIVSSAVLYFGKCSPSDHKGMSNEELEYMKNSSGDKSIETMRKLSVPWKRILTSVPVLMLAIAHWSNSWAFWTINTLTPTYMNGVLHFDVQSNGFLSALPPLTSLLLSFLFTLINVKIKNVMRPLYAKFMWNSIGSYGSAIALVVLAYTRDTATAIALITFGSGVIIACNLGFQTNHIDLSPNFAGILYSFTNSVANFASIIGPLISTYLVRDISDVNQWKIVFLLAAAVSAFGNTCYLFWGSAKKQEWNEGEIEKTPVE